MVDSPDWTGTDGHARPLHITLLIFACLGMIIDPLGVVGSVGSKGGLGPFFGIIASLVATVGASLFLGTNCGDRCLRNPTVAQAIFWLLIISMVFSLGAVIAAGVDLGSKVCYGESWDEVCYGSNSIFDAPIIGWHVVLGLFAALCLWKTFPATNMSFWCCANGVQVINTNYNGGRGVVTTVQQQPQPDARGCSAVDAPAWTGTDGHARPLHITLLLFACVGLFIDLACCFLWNWAYGPLPWGMILGGIASLFATVGASLFLGTNCGDRCLRNPTVAQAIFWLLIISMVFSLGAVIALGSMVSRDWSSIFDAPIIGWHLVLGLFAALCLWKSLPAARGECACCAGGVQVVTV
ncbi:hypothetical protein T484DRAFT_1943047, partial [Baffinella frigidus]